MRLSSYRWIATAPAALGFAVPAGLSVQLSTAIIVMPAGQFNRNTRLTLLDAAIILFSAATTLSLESAQVQVSIGVAGVSLPASIGAVTALIGPSPGVSLRATAPWQFDSEEMVAAGLFSTVAVGCAFAAVINNSGAAATASYSNVVTRWQFENFDAGGADQGIG